MRLSTRDTRLLLLLVPSLATALAPTVAADAAGVGSAEALQPRADAANNVAPVDGNDGLPHNGPWVETDGKVDDRLPPLEGRPDDPTVVDGQKIPDSHDGVMDDPKREVPKEGTRGTEGGVSEKVKAVKEQEGAMGEGVERTPETPKEAPVHHHEEVPADVDAVVGDAAAKEDGEASGLEKPEDLPERPDDNELPVPGSVNTDHLSVASPPTPESVLAPEGVIQPFHSFALSLTMIVVSEIGDKTFLVAALMAMKHDRMVVFSAAFAALLVMTVLSAVLGHAVPTLIPKRLTSFMASILFFVFGAKLLREGFAMSPDEGVAEEMHEVERELAEKEKEKDAYALEMGISHGGNRKSRPKNRFPAPPRSPSASPDRSPSPSSRSLSSYFQGLENLVSLLLSPAWVQTFVMTFLGEWGDRSQIATIAMAAGQDYWWVTLGATAGHCFCTGIAVIGGRAIAGRVSMKKVTIGGALAFLVFGFIYLYEAMSSS